MPITLPCKELFLSGSILAAKIPCVFIAPDDRTAMQEPSSTLIGNDRERRSGDRRQTTWTSIILGGIGKNRRRGPRRRGDHRGYYVDWYESRLLAVSLGILFLCCIDAWFTLTLLGDGAKELNVLMDMLIQRDVNTFVHVKLGVTAVGLVYLVAHSSFRVHGLVLVRHVLYVLLGSYVLLFIYQLSMLASGAQSV
jgi:hypothetical protein